MLDAGCGTGRYFSVLTSAPARVVGMDLSLGRLHVARNKHPTVPLVRADLHAPWPFCNNGFDAILCALVGEHLDRLSPVCVEMWRILAPGGCVVFPVYHAAMAAEGKEANFRKGGAEYRLGAYLHTISGLHARVRAGRVCWDHHPEVSWGRSTGGGGALRSQVRRLPDAPSV